MFKRYKLRNYDFKLVLMILAASIIGIMAVGSANESLQPKQIFGVCAGMVIMVIISLIAAFLARDPDSSVFRVVSFAWAGFGAAFGPTVLFALFWKRSTKWGALAGMISGGAMVFIWKYLIAPMGGVWGIYELLPAFLVSSVMIVVVSLATEKPDAETERLFEEVKAM